MWWPSLGGLIVGLGGLIFPQALGVGYETIGALVQGDVPRLTIAGVLIVKSVIWAVALGSGTSGGVLAPLLMIGGAVGGVEAMFLPDVGVGFWPLISMGAILGGTMRLTEKIARRGFHLSREYAVDPLEILFVREVMSTSLVAFPASYTRQQVASSFRADLSRRRQRLYPVIDQAQGLVGLLTGEDIRNMLDKDPASDAPLGELARRDAAVAYAGEPLRIVVYRMAETGLTRLPVLDAPGGKLVGLVSLEDLLRARARNLTEERHRERVLRIRIPFASRTQTVS
jgi:CBS domain-containing protein